MTITIFFDFHKIITDQSFNAIASSNVIQILSFIITAHHDDWLTGLWNSIIFIRVIVRKSYILAEFLSRPRTEVI